MALIIPGKVTNGVHNVMLQQFKATVIPSSIKYGLAKGFQTGIPTKRFVGFYCIVSSIFGWNKTLIRMQE